MSDFDRLRARLDAPHAPAWRPEPGGDLVGTVAGLSNRTHPDWGAYPIVTVATADGELAWHAYGAVARQQLDDAAPSVGDLIAVRYEGKREASTGAFAGKGYHAWKVVVERAPTKPVSPARPADPWGLASGEEPF